MVRLRYQRALWPSQPEVVSGLRTPTLETRLRAGPSEGGPPWGGPQELKSRVVLWVIHRTAWAGGQSGVGVRRPCPEPGKLGAP